MEKKEKWLSFHKNKSNNAWRAGIGLCFVTKGKDGGCGAKSLTVNGHHMRTSNKKLTMTTIQIELLPWHQFDYRTDRLGCERFHAF